MPESTIMPTFQPGWWITSPPTQTTSQYCRYFDTAHTVLAECIIQASGLKILTWWSPNGERRDFAWSADFVWLATATGEWWNNMAENTTANTPSPRLPQAYSRAERQPTLQELCQRVAHADGDVTNGLMCSRQIHVAIFFDGTNNNLYRDMRAESTLDRSHTNVVNLYNAHKEDRITTFRYYIPGVGTPFKEIGELGENPYGKSMGEGGEARIHYALLQVLNAVHYSSLKSNLFTDDDIKTLCTSKYQGLATLWRLGDDKLRRTYQDLIRRLEDATRNAVPRISTVRVSVFGFSRGAAAARTFCNWLRHATQASGGMRIGASTVRLDFLGIFDTVASVAFPDSSPVGGQGFLDWADGTMEVDFVEQVVHYVAAHEIRKSFPLSTMRIGKAYPANVKEFVYPGAHSDIGGGYRCGSQGKSVSARAALLSQIPLLDMYFEAKNGGVQLSEINLLDADVQDDFQIDPDLDALFSAYADWTMHEEKSNVATDGGLPVESRMHDHMGLYWRWRAKVGHTDAAFANLDSYRRSNAQDRQDLWESELDWRRSVKYIQAAHAYLSQDSSYAPIPQYKHVLDEISKTDNVPEAASRFFDHYVHDSHAGFWVLGPVTEYDRQQFIAALRSRQRTYELLMELGRQPAYANHSLYLQAERIKLNRFELRVLDIVEQDPDAFPLMTDADAADLRENAGMVQAAVLRMMGTMTRREPFGHARYRAVFDRS